MTIPPLGADETFIPVGPISTVRASQIIALHGRKPQDMFVLYGGEKLPAVISFSQSMGSLDDVAVVYDIKFASPTPVAPNFDNNFTFGLNIGGGHSVRFDMRAISLAVGPGPQMHIRFHFVPNSCRLVHTPQPAPVQAYAATMPTTVVTYPMTSAMYGSAYTVTNPQFNTMASHWVEEDEPLPPPKKRARPKKPKPPEPEPNLPKRAFAIGKKH